MISAILNAIVGLALVYLSVLHLALIEGRAWHLMAAAVAIIVLASWSRAGDAMKWFSTTTIVFGVSLLLFSVFQWTTTIAHLFTFWCVFLDGIMVAILSLWAALYRPVARLTS